jgi:hypothetical protein
VKYIPIVNTLYFLLDERTPAIEDIQTLCNSFTLVLALFLTVSGAIPMSTSIEELLKADGDWYLSDDETRSGKYGCVGLYKWPITISQILADKMWESYSVLMFGMFLGILTITMSSSMSSDGSRDVSARARAEFWKWTKVPTFIMIASTFVGCGLTGFALQKLMLIKWPYYSMAKCCKEAGWVSSVIFAKNEKNNGKNPSSLTVSLLSSALATDNFPSDSSDESCG